MVALLDISFLRFSFRDSVFCFELRGKKVPKQGQGWFWLGALRTLRSSSSQGPPESLWAFPGVAVIGALTRIWVDTSH